MHARGVGSEAHQNRGVGPPPDPLHHPGGGPPGGGAAGARQAAVQLHGPPRPALDLRAPAPAHVWDRGGRETVTCESGSEPEPDPCGGMHQEALLKNFVDKKIHTNIRMGTETNSL